MIFLLTGEQVRAWGNLRLKYLFPILFDCSTGAWLPVELLLRLTELSYWWMIVVQVMDHQPLSSLDDPPNRKAWHLIEAVPKCQLQLQPDVVSTHIGALLTMEL